MNTGGFYPASPLHISWNLNLSPALLRFDSQRLDFLKPPEYIPSFGAYLLPFMLSSACPALGFLRRCRRQWQGPRISILTEMYPRMARSKPTTDVSQMESFQRTWKVQLFINKTFYIVAVKKKQIGINKTQHFQCMSKILACSKPMTILWTWKTGNEPPKRRVLHNLSTSTKDGMIYDISRFLLGSIHFYWLLLISTCFSIDRQPPATSESRLNGLIHNEKSLRWLTSSGDEWHRWQESW